MTTALIVIGFLLITALAGYATALLLKLRKQSIHKKKHQQEFKDINQARLDEHLNSIRYIATAMLEDRCELSEGVMRIAKLFNILSMSEQVEAQYPAIFKHFSVIQAHPIMTQRKKLQKQQRMKLDFARMRSEAGLEADILEEAKQLSSFTPSPLH
ncbi:DUF2489 domain-containing protein [Shewanella benthica]|uniref:DUF2489 domain-containing protein n=1 Tax=Shewanella benthica KT99 TaxID=314608 RepID=A9CYI2_9GAMM|nr:DUF2489 domain-containing protein [Shewanella benthica]EDQ02486.1 hypothetical protein KT99_03197 [Shewanella benthica KT99]